MALLIKSVINSARLTTQVKHLIVPQLFAAHSAYSFKAMDAWKKHEVVPDVIAVAPSDKIEVSYPTSKVSVDFGNILTPTQVQKQPQLSWPVVPDTYYTICMTDPDAPNRKEHTFREWHHWLVVNIPGYDISKGEDLSEYIGAGPPPESGLHRYVFLAYKQPSKLTFSEPHLTNRSDENRAKFSISKFAAKYNLGNPVAGNFFQAEYDDYVPILYKQLGG